MQKERKREFPNPEELTALLQKIDAELAIRRTKMDTSDSSVIKSRIWISVDISACTFSATWISWKKKWLNSGSNVYAMMAAMIFQWNVHSIIVRWKCGQRMHAACTNSNVQQMSFKEKNRSVSGENIQADTVQYSISQHWQLRLLLSW